MRKTYTEMLLEFVCKVAQNEGVVLGVVGDSGIGKTTFLQELCCTHKNMFYLCLGKVKTPATFFQKIYSSVLLRTDQSPAPSAYSALIRCANAINCQSQTPLLIIDNMWMWSASDFYQMLAELKIQTRQKFGIVFVGPSKIKIDFEKLVTEKNNSVQSLVVAWQEIPLPTRVDLETFSRQRLRSAFHLSATLIEIEQARTYADLKRQFLKNNINKSLQYAKPDLHWK